MWAPGVLAILEIGEGGQFWVPIAVLTGLRWSRIALRLSAQEPRD
jgi:hypothetical protein